MSKKEREFENYQIPEQKEAASRMKEKDGFVAKEAIEKYEKKRNRKNLLNAAKGLLSTPLSILGVKGYYDVPAYLLQKRGVKKSQEKISDAVVNLEKEDTPNEFWEEFREKQTRIAEAIDLDQIEKIQNEIENSRSLTEDAKDNLLEELNLMIENYHKEKDDLINEQKKELDEIFDLYGETKISGNRAAKEGVRSLMVGGGGYLLSLPAYALIDLYGRKKRLTKEKIKEKRKTGKEEKVKFFKDVLVGGVKETFQNLAFKGENNKRKGKWGRSVNFLKALGNTLRYTGMSAIARGGGGYGAAFKNLENTFDNKGTLEAMKEAGVNMTKAFQKSFDNILKTYDFDQSFSEIGHNMGENYEKAYERLERIFLTGKNIAENFGEYKDDLWKKTKSLFGVGTAWADNGNGTNATEAINATSGNATVRSGNATNVGNANASGVNSTNATMSGANASDGSGNGTEKSVFNYPLGELNKEELNKMREKIINLSEDFKEDGNYSGWKNVKDDLSQWLLKGNDSDPGNTSSVSSVLTSHKVPDHNLSHNVTEAISNEEKIENQHIAKIIKKYIPSGPGPVNSNNLSDDDFKKILEEIDKEKISKKAFFEYLGKHFNASGKASEFDVTEFKKGIKKGDNIWKVAEKFLQEKYGKGFSDLGGNDNILREALQTYNIDRFKDEIADIINGKGKYADMSPAELSTLKKELHLEGIKNPDQVTLKQLKTIDWEKIHQRVFGDYVSVQGSHLTENIDESDAKSIVKHNHFIKEYAHKFGAPHDSEIYDKIIKLHDQGENDIDKVHEAIFSAESHDSGTGSSDSETDTGILDKYLESSDNKTQAEIEKKIVNLPIDKKEELLKKIDSKLKRLGYNDNNEASSNPEKINSLLPLRRQLLDDVREHYEEYKGTKLRLEDLSTKSDALARQNLDNNIKNIFRKKVLFWTVDNQEEWAGSGNTEGLKDKFVSDILNSKEKTNIKLKDYLEEAQKAMGKDLGEKGLPQKNETVEDYLLRYERHLTDKKLGVEDVKKELERLEERKGVIVIERSDGGGDERRGDIMVRS